jgi:uridine kinase
VPELLPPCDDPDRTAAEIAARARAAGGRPVVLVDGRSGAGKTELARRLAPLLDAQLVSLDDLYPGWSGLDAGADAVVETVLRRRDPGWTRWDWARSEPAEWHPLDPTAPLVVEGCGAIGRRSVRRADLAVWIELDAASRRARALRRDGRTYEPHWDRWAAQEANRIRRERSPERADLIVPGGTGPDGDLSRG